MIKLTNSQLALQFMFDSYPCLRDWMQFVKTVVPDTYRYDSAGCAQVAQISSAAMKTFDYILKIDPNASIIRVSKMLHDQYSGSWNLWTAFNAQSSRATGSRTITMSPTALQSLTSFQSWDHARYAPNFSPSDLLHTILIGVTL